MGDEESVLFSNDRFYAAFSGKDFDAMQQLWGLEKVTCVHPGWPPLYGREDVMDSWDAILGEDNAPNVRCRAPRAAVFGDMATVVCIEELDSAFLCATNIFVRQSENWRLVHHHAGPINVNPEELPDEPEVAFN
ncbi:MAG: nuclear transport factor 2 family protein [Rhodospirillaceae bacterium]|nr:nuclear transport factor 2 family protein [Rhodospirillaceae bacterium]